MKYLKRPLILFTFFILSCLPVRAISSDSFKTPPDSAKPWVYWFWVNGNLTREGITADLESMKRVGIGGVIIMEVDKGEPKGSYPFASPAWRELFAFMLDEARRLGLKVTMNNDGGWCGSGGPWMPVEKSMQKVVWSETVVHGPCSFRDTLPEPASVDGYYRDISVLAFPTPRSFPKGIAGFSPVISSNAKPEGFHASRIIDKNNRTASPFPRPVPGSHIYIDFDFDSPVPISGMTMTLGGKNWVLEGRILCDEGNGDFEEVKAFKGYAPSISIDFPQRMSRRVRVLLTNATKPGEQMKVINISDIDFCMDGLNNLGQKAMSTAPINNIPMLAQYRDAAEGIATAPGNVTDISGNMDMDGMLEWEAPDGDWTILRMGHTTTGKTNHTSPPDGVGYECDRLSKEASTLHFNHLAGLLADDSPDAVGNTFVATHIDSWESGSQNWTPDFIGEFSRRRGYDPTPYLPVIAGKIIGSKEISERFLWDFRATISDLMLENYTENMLALAHGKGLGLSIEGYRRCLTDELTYAGRADEPMAEFWAWPRYNFDFSCTQMASSAHIYGKRIVGAEAFTSGGGEAWQGHPANLKELGDWAFCEGINKFVIHRYAMQPYGNITPGMGMSATGLHYERTQTWWEMSTAWHEYLSRCQYMLQQGLFVADMCLIAPENLPQQWFSPYGRDSVRYRFDACPPEAVMTRLAVKDGLITLPDGMSYRILVMPDSETMSPGLLRRIMELVRDGATLVGAPPRKAMGLSGYPESDETVRSLADSLWGPCDGVNVTENRYGLGRVIRGRSPEKVLEEMGVGRDFTSDTFLRSIHKTMPEGDVYFVANPADSSVTTKCRFRVQGPGPEIWDPMTGEVFRVVDYVSADGHVEMPLTLDPTGSLFVVFPTRKSSGRTPVYRTAAQGNVPRSKGGGPGAPAEAAASISVEGPWEVSFTDGMGAPAGPVYFSGLSSWTEHPDSNIRYYSGNAIYRKDVFIPGKMARKGVILDLGRVEVMARVSVNGKDLGILWKKPFRLDITDAVKPGLNSLEIKVVNLWTNRLIGDERMPDRSVRDASGGELKEWPQWVLDGGSDPDGRHTFTTWKLLKADAPTVESGLIGPVSIMTGRD